MTAAGWYRDGTDGVERWWDGASWTEHVRSTDGDGAGARSGWIGSVGVGGEPVHVVDRGVEVVGDPTCISVRGRAFALDAVDRVVYQRTIRRLNGAYMGTSFHIRLGQGDMTDQFMLDSGHRDRRLAEFEAAWTGLVRLLEARACPRIADTAIASIMGGGRVTIGHVVLGSDGVRSRWPWSRPVPWQDIAGTELTRFGELKVLVRKSGSTATKPRFTNGVGYWNVVVLPRVIAYFTG